MRENSSEYAPLKQRAWDAAAEAVCRVREEASDREMETATVQSVQPMIREYEHQQACKRIVGRVYIFDATREEQEAAKEEVWKALAALPIGAATKELEKAEETALTPHRAAVAQRKEKTRLELEKQAGAVLRNGRPNSNWTTSRAISQKNTNSTADTPRWPARRTGFDL